MTTVLLVDDNRLVASTLKRAIHYLLGFETRIAESIAEAQCALESGGVDFVLTDYLFPPGHATGVVVATCARAHGVPAAFLLGDLDSLTVEERAEVEQWPALRKPASSHDVCALIRHAVA